MRMDAPLFRGQPGLALVRSQRAARIGVTVDATLEVLEQEVVAIAADHEVRCDLDLATAAGRIDREDRRRITGRVAAQTLDDLKTLLDRGAEMGRAADRVALIEIVWTNSVFQQPLHQRPHD